MLNVRTLLAITLLGVLYYGSGRLGLMVESAVGGITPIWPPSGVAIAAVILFGYRLLPGILLGMILLAYFLDIPWQITLLAAAGSTLEASIPVVLMRKFGFVGRFDDLSDVLIFSSIAVLLGPVFSATLGAFAFVYFNPANTFSFFTIWILWWLGNSLGILVVGSFLLEWHSRVRIRIRAILQALVIAVLASLICFLSLKHVDGIYSTLLLFTILPLTVLAAICCEVKGSSFVTVIILLIFTTSAAWLPSDVFKAPDLSYFYLNAAFIAINAFIGMVVGTSVRKQKALVDLERRYLNEAEQLITARTAELDATQQQLIQAQKTKAIGTLAGGIAHEFNNLLTPIIGYSDMLGKIVGEDSRGKKYADRIYQAGKRAESLVKQILAYGRESMALAQDVELDEIVDDALNLIKHTIPSNISIVKRYEGDDFHINAMPNEIHQIILNLCINASQAMPDGGTLTLHLKRSGEHRFLNHEGLVREGEFMCLSVQDTGAGINPALVERIFDPFFTTKAVGEGTGLGLSVVQGIVEQHEGHIVVDSQADEGTTFKVYLPISDSAIIAHTVQTHEIHSDGRGYILLLDDEQMIIDFSQTSLVDMGYEVIAFTDCLEALDWMQENGRKVDLIITDYGMPNMDGKTFTEKVKQLNADVSVILMTGYGDLVSNEDIHTWGMEDLLLKPFNLHELGRVVNEVMRSDINVADE